MPAERGQAAAALAFGAAASLDARAASALPCLPGPAVAPWVARWEAVVGRGDATAFARRLAFDGWAADRLGWLADPPDDRPPWAGALAHALDGPMPPALAHELADLPGRGLVAPLVSASWSRLVARVPAAEARLGPAAARALRRAWAGDVAALIALAPDDDAGLDLPTLAASAPVLARLLGEGIGRAADAAATWLDLLEADAAALSATYGGELRKVMALRLLAAPPSPGGQQPVWLAFEGGPTLVYKPRDLRVDQAFAGLLCWLEGRGLPAGLRVPRTFTRDGHGWAEGIAPAPCTDAAGPARYFRRAGQLAAILYALDGTDAHADNLIAVGDTPVLVDLEAVMQPAFRDDALGPPGAEPGASDPLAGLGRRVAASVLQTSLIARPAAGPHGLRDDGGLANPPPGGGRCANLPWHDGRPVSARAHVGDVLAGFHEAYALLVREREALLAPDGPLAAFAGVPVRAVFRPPHAYARLLTASLAPGCLAHGLERSFLLDRLTRTCLRGPTPPPAWPVVAHERRVLEALDHPRFTVAADGRALEGAGPPVPLFAAAPLARARERRTASSLAAHPGARHGRPRQHARRRGRRGGRALDRSAGGGLAPGRLARRAGLAARRAREGDRLGGARRAARRSPAAGARPRPGPGRARPGAVPRRLAPPGGRPGGAGVGASGRRADAGMAR